MGDAGAERHHQEQCPRVGVQRQQAHHQQAAQDGAANAVVAPLHGLRQVAAHDHHDGGQYPVFVRRPRQMQ